MPRPGPARDSRSRRDLLRTAAGVAAAGLSGCAGADDGPGTDRPSSPAPADPVRLAAHEFVPVGETRPLGNLGEILEVVEFDGALDVDAEARTFTPTEGGVACIRARYRDDPRQNSVQTKCVVGVDEVGPCDGHDPYAFDLQRFADRPGDSNWLASGTGAFYAVCETAGGLRLQRSTRDLPPLYFGLVDALGDGAYSLGPAEFGPQRRGTVRTFSGAVLEPPWVAFLGASAGTGTITEAGEVVVDILDCRQSSECTTDARFLREGDIVEVGTADLGRFGDFRAEHGPEGTAARMDALLDRLGVTAFDWADIDGTLRQYDPDGELQGLVDEKVKGAVFERLVRLPALERTLAHFDEVHDLRAKGVTVSLRDALWNRPVGCPVPGEEPQAYCAELETAVAAAEARALAELREAYPLWVSLNAWEAPGRHRPGVEHFGGAVVLVGFAAESTPAADIEAAPAAATRLVAHAREADPAFEVVLLTEGPVSLFSEPGVQCEAAFCPSDFEASFRLNEAVIDALLESAPDSLAGIAVRTFEGAHFDIRQPVEDRSGYELNRAGETGYNNPVLNLYAAR